MKEAIANGSKSARFERLAVKRTADIIKKLKLLGNLSNRNNYAYSDAQIKQMFGAIDRELKLTRDRFNLQAASKEPLFRFSKHLTEG
jgi:hypothetical protein